MGQAICGAYSVRREDEPARSPSSDQSGQILGINWNCSSRPRNPELWRYGILSITGEVRVFLHTRTRVQVTLTCISYTMSAGRPVERRSSFPIVRERIHGLRLHAVAVLSPSYAAAPT